MENSEIANIGKKRIKLDAQMTPNSSANDALADELLEFVWPFWGVGV